MIDRNSVALEKCARAQEMLVANNLDAWIFYARCNQDPALALMFNTSARAEALFLLMRTGERLVFTVDPSDAQSFLAAGLFTRVETVTSDTIMACLAPHISGAQSVLLNISGDDARCDGLTKGLYEKLLPVLGNCQQVSSYPYLEELRAVKTPSEIAIMETCSRITTDVYDALFAQLHVGMRETDVGDIMIAELAKRDCVTGIGDGTEYPLILLVRCGVSHRKPNPNNYIKPGDMLIIDFSARYNGYTSDIARTMYFLKPDETHAPAEVTRCIEGAIRAVGEVLKVIKPGMHGYEVDAVGRQSILDSGYPNIPHSVGHQVGLECHDGGTVLGPNRQKAAMCGILRENEIYAIEPTVLQPDGLPCAIVEDNVILTENGCRLISKRQTAVIEIPYREA